MPTGVACVQSNDQMTTTSVHVMTIRAVGIAGFVSKGDAGGALPLGGATMGFHARLSVHLSHALVLCGQFRTGDAPPWHDPMGYRHGAWCSATRTQRL